MSEEEDFRLSGSVISIYTHDSEDLEDEPCLEIITVSDPQDTAKLLRRALLPYEEPEIDPFADRYLEVMDDLGVYHFLDASTVRYATVARTVLVEPPKTPTPRPRTKPKTVAKKPPVKSRPKTITEESS